ncbi:radical SAM protein [Sporanaerobium hydrogeniformans]|uniref:Radical SAM protein n=1 Tax=Sporanaerobium hydrogeniformans TaxID=3072179 RepID=A0AC61DEP4_9FIRM|nr:radical SAM protein [Sporanaerobium hydrogeniformans]PHV71350.1 radical SAM protein [Sporanaerobium hydrogeniformans]
MKAELKPYYDTNRKKLAEIIPLQAPFTVYIEQTRYCNFKCFYCMHATRDIEGGAFQQLGHRIKHMDFNMFELIIKQLKEFPTGIKRIVFSGLGEPLMNPALPDMVKLAVDSGVADRVEIITNGALLTPETSDKLIKAGVTNINISIQGISAIQYEETCGVKIDFNRFVDNLKYLYDHKGNIQIYIKAIDATLKTKEAEQAFFDIFGNICDKIYIEHLIVMQKEMEELKAVVDESRNFYNEKMEDERKVCAQSFYFLQIGCDYDLFPCPNPGLPVSLSMGNLKENTLLEIWNGEKRKKLLRTMLEFNRNSIPTCDHCTTFKCISNSAENLDMDAKNLIKYFE